MTEQEQKVERHLIETSVDDAAGTQVWWVDAISKEDALLKFESGEGEIYSNEVEVVKLGEPLHIGTTNLDDFGDGDKPLSEATTTITVPRATWDAVVEVLEAVKKTDLPLSTYANAGHESLEDAIQSALTAANAVSHPKPETAPSPEGGAITSESAANAVSHPQATEPQARGDTGRDA